MNADLTRLRHLAAQGNPTAIRAAQAYERMRRHPRGSNAHKFERRTVERLAQKAAQEWIKGDA